MMALYKQQASHGARGWALALGLLLMATLAGLLLERYVSITSQAMIYVLAVVIAAYKLGWVESVACAVGAVTALNFFFVPPRRTFEIESREHFIALGVMLVVALVISRLASGLRRETDMARLNERRAHQLQTLATDLAGAATPQDVLSMGRFALQAAFDGPCVLVLASPTGNLAQDGELASDVRDGLNCCLREQAVLGPGTGRWPGLQAWYLPLAEQGMALGAACISPAPAGDIAGRAHAQALCALLAQSLRRLQLVGSMRAAQGEAQRQQLQSTLLAAISHDLRTPLAAIVAAATSLQTQRDRLGAADQDRLLETIVSEAAYLDAMTDNTLQLVRLAGSSAAIQRNWESVEEIVGAVLGRLRRHDPARRIRSSVPQDLPLIKADPVLLSQLLGNLLGNALQYSGGDVELTVQVQPKGIEVCVHDRGPGIPESEREAIFQPYVRGDHAGRRGTGLGLAVCRAIAQAHQAELHLSPRVGGGSSFCLVLPVDVQPSAAVPAKGPAP